MSELTERFIKAMCEDAIGLNSLWTRKHAEQLRDMALRSLTVESAIAPNIHTQALHTIAKFPIADTRLNLDAVNMQRIAGNALLLSAAAPVAQEAVAWADRIAFESAMKAGKGCDVWPKRGDSKRDLMPLYAAPVSASPEDRAHWQKQFIDTVEKLAFEMRPPNAYTPRFVQLCNEARSYMNNLPIAGNKEK